MVHSTIFTQFTVVIQYKKEFLFVKYALNIHIQAVSKRIDCFKKFYPDQGVLSKINDVLNSECYCMNS